MTNRTHNAPSNQHGSNQALHDADQLKKIDNHTNQIQKIESALEALQQNTAFPEKVLQAIKESKPIEIELKDIIKDLIENDSNVQSTIRDQVKELDRETYKRTVKKLSARTFTILVALIAATAGALLSHYL